MTAHTCHARGCEVAAPPSMFMCKPHWTALPRAMRQEILEAYKPGQERRKDPSRRYLDAARSAVEWLARQTTPAECCNGRGIYEQGNYIGPCPSCGSVPPSAAASKETTA